MVFHYKTVSPHDCMSQRLEWYTDRKASERLNRHTDSRRSSGSTPNRPFPSLSTISNSRSQWSVALPHKGTKHGNLCPGGTVPVYCLGVDLFLVHLYQTHGTPPVQTTMFCHSVTIHHQGLIISNKPPQRSLEEGWTSNIHSKDLRYYYYYYYY